MSDDYKSFLNLEIDVFGGLGYRVKLLQARNLMPVIAVDAAVLEATSFVLGQADLTHFMIRQSSRTKNSGILTELVCKNILDVLYTLLSPIAP